MKKMIMSLPILLLAIFQSAYADIDFRVVGERMPKLESNVLAAARANFDLTQYRQLRLHLPAQSLTYPNHAVLFLFSKKYHRFDLASVTLSPNGDVTGLQKNYQLRKSDVPEPTTATCPDPSVQFIAFAPNDDATEQGDTVQVANAAIAKGLKTVQLLKADATAQAYLNYMSCPNLVGNFYDGDADPTVITTVDGTISSDTINTLLTGAFRYKVVNIWLACEAYNDPMLTTMISGAQSQKYAAGKNDLEVGPSDDAGACAMEAAINGQAMTAAFNSCYTKFDNSSDQWGFGGNGSDLFGQ